MSLIIDAHQHFWDIASVSYPWLRPEYAAIYRTFGPNELEPQLRVAGVDGTVLVQSANGFEDTRAMLEQADRFSWIKAVVGWVPLTEAAIAARAIEVLAVNPKFKGVRHLIHDEPNVDYLLKPEVLEGLRLLADHGLTFDVVSVLPRHLEHVSSIAAHVPHLKIVIDHLSKPPIKDGGWEPWASLLLRASEHPNVYAKVSGLNTAADWESWSAGDLERYVNHALECFGANRLMFGSDWPVALFAGDYAKVWHETNVVLEKLVAGDKERVLGGTAIDFYGLEATR
jgi:L-fuconolactonase